ncbi:MAG TPA: helix-turn-helix domain-containing protein [Nocardioidaceae bacterium]|nr:helix-turn-helix domain-containing protein [Nocardioidaceae bacterium]
MISAEFGISQPAVSMQLRVLRESGFADARPEGPHRMYASNPTPMADVGPGWASSGPSGSSASMRSGTEIARGRSKRARSGQ